MSSTLHVLVVEDDESSLQMMMTLVEMWGYEADGASSAADALTLVQQRCPHVVLSDLVMPGMSGMDLMKALRASGCPIFFVLITGHPSVSKVVDAIHQGADDCLVKPVDTDKLRRMLEVFDAKRQCP